MFHSISNDGVYDWVILRRKRVESSLPANLPNAESQKPSFLQPIPPYNPNYKKRLEEKEREKALLRESEKVSKVNVGDPKQWSFLLLIDPLHTDGWTFGYCTCK